MWYNMVYCICIRLSAIFFFVIEVYYSLNSDSIQTIKLEIGNQEV